MSFQQGSASAHSAYHSMRYLQSVPGDSSQSGNFRASSFATSDLFAIFFAMLKQRFPNCVHGSFWAVTRNLITDSVIH